MWTQPGVDSFARFRAYLETQGLWDEKQEQELIKEAKQYMLKEIKIVENKKSFAILPGIFDDVYDKMPWHIQVRTMLKMITLVLLLSVIG